MTPVEPRDDAAELARRKKEREEFIDRVREGEQLAAANPARYRAQLRRMVALGYGYIVLVLLATVSLLTALILLRTLMHTRVPIQIYIFLGLFLFAVVRSIPIRVKRPKQVLITRSEAPILYSEVDKIADTLKAPRPDQIQVDARFNASAGQYPQFGMFGRNINILTLGLPYLLSSTPDEMRSVIGHELGHFSGKHGRLGVAIYRIEATWEALRRNLHRTGRSDFIFRPFVEWYAPRLSAMTFAMRRQNEYEADASAAEATSPEIAARALAFGAARHTLLGDEFWEPFNEKIAKDGLPAPGYLDPMANAVRQPLATEAGTRATKEALADITDYSDTHPALKDRLRALGQPLEVSLETLSGPSAAEAFFGSALAEVTRRVEKKLLSDYEESWKEYHADQSRRQARRAELLQSANQKPLTEKEAIELAIFEANEKKSLVDQVPIYRTVAEQYPSSDRAACYYGAALLEVDDPAGVAILEERSRNDAKLREYAIRILGSYHARTGEQAELDRIRTEAHEIHDRKQIARQALGLRLDNDLLSPDLTGDERAKLLEQLRTLPQLGRAYVFRKQLPGTGEFQDFLFVLPPPKLEISGALEKLVDLVVKEVSFRGHTMVYSLEPRKDWRRRLDTVPEALIYDRKEMP